MRSNKELLKKCVCEREREKELNLRGNWGENYREFKREGSKKMYHYLVVRLELQVGYLYRDLLQSCWLFIQHMFLNQ